MNEKIIAALDFSSRSEVESFLKKIPSIRFVKVGMELYAACGPDIIKYLKDKDLKVFLDVKLHDVPNTIQRTTSIMAAQGADIITIHASGGIDMMRAAKLGVGDYIHKPKLFAVTKLKSISDEILRNQLGIDQTLKATVQRYAANSVEAGMDGVIASVHEASALKNRFGDMLEIATPGIRLMHLVGNESARIGTPSQAIQSGADYLVVGRCISHANDPEAVFEEILNTLILTKSSKGKF